MKIKAKNCIDCGIEGTYERRRCKKCAIAYNTTRVKAYYSNLKEEKIDRNRYGKINCCVCGHKMIKNRPNQISHGKCRTKQKMPYNNYPRDKKGMMVGRRTVINLGIKITAKQIVHHIDENPINNYPNNLLVMNRRNHRLLHAFLEAQWLLNKKLHGNKLENMWKEMLFKYNFIWIEESKIKLIELKIGRDHVDIEMNNEDIYCFKK